MGKSQDEVRTIAETDYLRLVSRGKWSYVQRTNDVKVVAIAAVTPKDEIVFVEQFRPPVQCNVIELPAGLAGDISGAEGESLQKAAERELLEETGYVAKSWRRIADLSSSAGLTSEVVTLFLAQDLVREQAGGGIDDEQIIVHLIPKATAVQWLQAEQDAGKLIDSRVFTGLFFSEYSF